MFGQAAVALAHCPGESVPAPGGAAKKVPKSTEMRVPSRRGCENMRCAKHASAGWGARSWCGACECATIGLTISPASAMARTRCYGPAKLQFAGPIPVHGTIRQTLAGAWTASCCCQMYACLPTQKSRTGSHLCLHTILENGTLI